jgi:hypothetical protein
LCCRKPPQPPLQLQYKFHEDIFDQLLLTPELDRQLAAGDNSTKWAASNVEAAVSKAIRIAYYGESASRANSPSNGSSSSSNSSSAASSFDTVRMGDGMGAVGHSQPSGGPTVAAAAAMQHPAVDNAAAASPGGCNSNNDDEQCEVDWDALFASFEEDLEVHTVNNGSSKNNAGKFAAQAAPGSSSMEFISDEAAAAGAAKVEAATNEPFDVTAAHSFLQRLLYKINRLNHFW